MKLNAILGVAGSALALCLCGGAHAAAAEEDGAALLKAIHAPLAFTGAEAHDFVTVTFLESEPESDVVVFVVRDANGRPVYADAVALSALDWEDPVETWTLDGAHERLWLSSELLSRFETDLVPRADAGVGAFWPIADEARLARARQADRPLLCYVNAPGGVTCAWYDDELGRGIALIEGAS